MIQKAKKNLDPKIQANSANLDPEIQNSEAEFDEGDAATIQNVTKFTDLTTIPNPAPEIQATVQRPEIIASKIHNIQEDEDEYDGRSIYLGCDDRSATIVVQRPPPEPPDLNSDAVTGVHSGAEDGAVAKGNVDITEVEPAVVENDVDDKSKSSTEVGASVKEKRRRFVARVEGAPSVTGGGLRALGFCYVSPIVAKPPLLIAADGLRTDGAVATTGGWLIVATQNMAAELNGDQGASWKVANEWKKGETVPLEMLQQS
ncbi:hypothetical protein PIB30_060224 [Stylosanthes scabra]|uniref:Uncharacterized protein n=1 Tax=Stylosanthes scabra TaxID=79078 RepID=A0ABU6TLS5_9FABA|nr:hypothetical protein [Stylosanthes scabra]